MSPRLRPTSPKPQSPRNGAVSPQRGTAPSARAPHRAAMGSGVCATGDSKRDIRPMSPRETRPAASHGTNDPKRDTRPLSPRQTRPSSPRVQHGDAAAARKEGPRPMSPRVQHTMSQSALRSPRRDSLASSMSKAELGPDGAPPMSARGRLASPRPQPKPAGAGRTTPLRQADRSSDVRPLSPRALSPRGGSPQQQPLGGPQKPQRQNTSQLRERPGAKQVDRSPAAPLQRRPGDVGGSIGAPQGAALGTGPPVEPTKLRVPQQVQVHAVRTVTAGPAMSATGTARAAAYSTAMWPATGGSRSTTSLSNVSVLAGAGAGAGSAGSGAGSMTLQPAGSQTAAAGGGAAPAPMPLLSATGPFIGVGRGSGAGSMTLQPAGSLSASASGGAAQAPTPLLSAAGPFIGVGAGGGSMNLMPAQGQGAGAMMGTTTSSGVKIPVLTSLAAARLAASGGTAPSSPRVCVANEGPFAGTWL